MREQIPTPHSENMSCRERNCRMYNELTYKVRSSNNVAKHFLLALAGTAIILIALSNMVDHFSGLICFGAFIFAVAAIYIYTRYMGIEYCYQIANLGVPTMVVSVISGKRSRTMARIDISSITEVQRLTLSEYRAYKSEKGILKYNYFPTMLPSAVYLVRMRSEHENADIFIEANERFASALREGMEWQENISLEY